jgi:hypothetical protein
MLNDPNGPCPSTSGSTVIYPQQDFVEADDILFETASSGTIIKNYAQNKLPLFKSLSDREKNVVGKLLTCYEYKHLTLTYIYFFMLDYVPMELLTCPMLMKTPKKCYLLKKSGRPYQINTRMCPSFAR